MTMCKPATVSVHVKTSRITNRITRGFASAVTSLSFMPDVDLSWWPGFHDLPKPFQTNDVA